MTVPEIADAYDKIRLIRRKIRIQQQIIASDAPRPARDHAMTQISHLQEILVEALHDFADLGFESVVADLVTCAND